MPKFEVTRNGEKRIVETTWVRELFASALESSADVREIPDDASPVASPPAPPEPVVAEQATVVIAPNLLHRKIGIHFELPKKTLVLEAGKPIPDVLRYEGEWLSPEETPNAREKREKQSKPPPERRKMKFVLIGRRRPDGTIIEPSQIDGDDVRFADFPDKRACRNRFFKQESDAWIVLQYPEDYVEGSEQGSNVAETVPVLPPPPVLPPTLDVWIKAQDYSAFIQGRVCEDLIAMCRPKIVHTQQGDFVELLTFKTMGTYKGQDLVAQKDQQVRPWDCACTVDDITLNGKDQLSVQESNIGFKTLQNRDSEVRIAKRIHYEPGTQHVVKCYLADGNKLQYLRNVDDWWYKIIGDSVELINATEYNTLLAEIKKAAGQQAKKAQLQLPNGSAQSVL